MIGLGWLGVLLTTVLAAGETVAPPTIVPPPVATAPPSGQIRGTISYGRHEPAAGVVVVVRPESTPSPVHAATTGTNGTFAFDGLPDGTYRADVRREGYRRAVKTGLHVKAPFRAIVEVLLERGTSPAEAPPASEGSASLAGTIRLSGGSPVAEAHVRLTRPDGAADSKVALTDAAGKFAWTELPAGRWHFDVQAAGLLPLHADLDLSADVSFEAQLAPQPANYRPLAQDLLVPEEVIPPPESPK
jgi:hypothetical protein